MAKLPKKPNIVLSNIPEQNKRGANSLTIEEWNSIINKLKLQGDLTVRYLHQLHQLLVYSGSDTDDPYLDIELSPDGYGFLTDSVLKLRGDWNPTTNQPELSPFDKSKRGWLYRVTADAEATDGFPEVRKDDWVVYNNDGYLISFDLLSIRSAIDEAIKEHDVLIGTARLFTTTGPMKGRRTIDGVTLSEGDKVLVTGQGALNGIYIAKEGQWVRMLEVKPNQVVSIDEGFEYGGSMQKKLENGATTTVKNPERSKWKVFN